MSVDEEGSISGPDSEEILAELVETYAPRDVIALHRAAIRGDVAKIRQLVQNGTHVDATLLPFEAFEEVSKCNELDMEKIQGVKQQTTPYPEVPQITTGDDDEPNELYPTGDVSEPETNLDTLFQSPLLRAAQTAQIASVEVLIELGANRSFESPCKQTAVTVALQDAVEPTEVAQILRIVATPQTICPTSDTTIMAAATNKTMQKYPLLLATMEEGLTVSDEVVKTLLDLGAVIPSDLRDQSIKEWLPENIANEILSRI